MLLLRQVRRLRWVAARARAMSGPEMAWRVRTALKARSEGMASRLGSLGPLGSLGSKDSAAVPSADAGIGEAILFGSRPLAFLPGEGADRAELKEALASLPRLPLADRGARDWNRDPETGRTFPLVHWSRVDYREPLIEGGVRRLWYAARHLDVPDRALAYYLNPDPEAAAVALAPILTWIDQCPPGRGIHWTVPLEMGLRLIAWGYALRLLAGAPALGAAAPRIARAIDAQAEHILAYRSRYSSANNHLIAQAAGLLHAGFAFSGRPRAARWREVGAGILWEEIERQTTPDGVSRELSLHYQELVLELGLLSWLVLRANGSEPPARTRLGAMLDFVAELDRFPGGPPDFGDSDGQSALPFQSPATPRASILALGAVLCERPDWLPATRSLTRPAAVLLGAEGRERFHALPLERPGFRSRFYPDGGLALCRDASGDRGLSFDCGPLGFLATAAHGHADCLAIALGALREPLLIDPGTFTYHAEPRYRDHFRSTAAHTTIRVDGEEQSEMLGAFLWGRRAKARVELVAMRGAWDVIAASHNGYERLSSPVRHRRTVVFVKPDYFWITDELSGTGEHLVESFWHFAPGSTVASEGDWIWGRPQGAVELQLKWVGPAPRPPLELWEGAEHPIQGWSSARFGVRVPAPVLRLAAAQPLPWRSSMFLRPRPMLVGFRPDPEQVSAGQSPLGAGEVLWTRGMPGEDLLLRDDAAGELAIDGWRENLAVRGRLALLRRQGEEVTAVAGLGLTHFRLGDEDLVIAEAEGGKGVDFCVRRFGDQAVIEGRGGRVGLTIPGVREVRGLEGPLAVQRQGDRLWIDLGDAGREGVGGVL